MATNSYPIMTHVRNFLRNGDVFEQPLRLTTPGEIKPEDGEVALFKCAGQVDIEGFVIVILEPMAHNHARKNPFTRQLQPSREGVSLAWEGDHVFHQITKIPLQLNVKRATHLFL